MWYMFVINERKMKVEFVGKRSRTVVNDLEGFG